MLNFFVGSAGYYVDGQAQSMDAHPAIVDGRTLLPIRCVATGLGASILWNEAEQKVTVSSKGSTIELWIGRATARVDGAYVPIDPANPDVAPIIQAPGRTMLPLRFIAERLGCQVDWSQAQQEVTVTYTKP